MDDRRSRAGGATDFLSHGLLISAQVIAAFLALGLAFPGLAGAQQAHSGNYVYDTAEGKRVVPLPDGSWQKVLEHETDEVIDMGSYAADWKKGNVFLIRKTGARVDAIISINANISDILGERLAPPDFCYAKQRTWKWHKQFRALATDTYCWGVNLARIPIKAESEAEAWQLLMEKNAAAKWGLADETPATQVRFLRWVKGRFLQIDYYFVGAQGAKPMAWRAARDWAKGIVARVKAGFDGETGATR